MKPIAVTATLVYRFNEKRLEVESGCHEWTGARMPKGYGFMKIPGARKQEYAHRLSWLINYGAIPEGKCVLHRCDNPGCVNPAHLWVGTKADNQADMARKGRSTAGEKNPRAKLTDTLVMDIIERLQKGESGIDLSFEYGVSFDCIEKIARGERWKHIRRDGIRGSLFDLLEARKTRERVKSYLALGMSQSAAAKVTGLSQTEVSKIHRGLRDDPSP